MSISKKLLNAETLNSQIVYTFLINVDVCQEISKAQSPKLKKVNLSGASIGADGLYYLIKANWRKIIQISLRILCIITAHNNLGSQGCQYLGQSDWPLLKELDLTGNQIDHNGCLHLSQANWPLLEQISLNSNQVSNFGCQYLSLAKWKFIRTILLTDNYIAKIGCKYLSEGSWPILSQIQLSINPIGNGGCMELCKGRWTSLEGIGLTSCQIQDGGCEYLFRGQWPKLKEINISNNNLTKDGIRVLAKLKISSDMKINYDFSRINLGGYSQKLKNHQKNLCYTNQSKV